MNFYKTVAVVSAMAISSFSASAEQLSVAGITWDSTYTNNTTGLYSDFFAGGTYEETLKDGDLSGNGVIALVNGRTADGIPDGTGGYIANTGFCLVTGCTLSYSFEGFVVNTDGTVDHSNGTLDFSVDNNDGSPESIFLSLTAAADFVYQSSLNSKNQLITELTGLFDVVSNIGAAANFDTDTQAGGTDMNMLVSRGGFSPLAPTEIINSSTFKSNSVPAPTTLAIFGLGLLGLARLRKAK